MVLVGSFSVADILPEAVASAKLPLPVSSLPPADAPGNGPTAEHARQAVISASNVIAQAEQLDYLWRDTERLLTEAKKAGQRGEFARTIALAQRAQHEAEMAINQAYLAKARYLISKIANRPLNDGEQQQLNLAREAYLAHRGREALELLGAIGAVVAP